MVVSLDLGWLQRVFNTLVGMFNQVGFCTIFRKTVGMVFLPYQAAGTQLEASYERRMAGEGVLYQERHIVKVKFL